MYLGNLLLTATEDEIIRDANSSDAETIINLRKYHSRMKANVKDVRLYVLKKKECSGLSNVDLLKRLSHIEAKILQMCEQACVQHYQDMTGRVSFPGKKQG
jgi:hypothetical protein